jgi:hypothetical protein
MKRIRKQFFMSIHGLKFHVEKKTEGFLVHCFANEESGEISHWRQIVDTYLKLEGFVSENEKISFVFSDSSEEF